MNEMTSKPCTARYSILIAFLLALALTLCQLFASSVSAAPGGTALSHCTKAALAKPEIISAEISRATTYPDGGSLRAIDIELGYSEMPADCRERIGRLSRPVLRIQNPEKRNRWTKVIVNISAYTSDEAGTNDNIIGSSDRGFFKCTPGPRKTGARLEITNKVIDKQKRQVIRTKRYTHQMRIYGSC